MSVSAIADSVRVSPMGRSNAVVKLLGALLITVVLVVSADPVTSGLALLGQLVLLAAAGQKPLRLLVTLWPITVAALISGWGTAMLSPEGGTELVNLGWITVTTGSLAAGAAIALRGLAIALPGITVRIIGGCAPPPGWPSSRCRPRIPAAPPLRWVWRTRARGATQVWVRSTRSNSVSAAAPPVVPRGPGSR